MLVRVFFWSVYLIVLIGVLNAVSWVDPPDRWKMLAFFGSILIFVAWAALRGKNRG
ncbi:hypothetical protein [Hyphomicrobium denitrificans]|nr:hypothetical protein [Hyphomicrobium denitrificans]